MAQKWVPLLCLIRWSPGGGGTMVFLPQGLGLLTSPGSLSKSQEHYLKYHSAQSTPFKVSDTTHSPLVSVRPAQPRTQ